MNVEIANKCPRCGGPVLVGPVHAGGVREQQVPLKGRVLAHDLALGYECLPCDWYVIQPEPNRMPVVDFLTAALAPEVTQ